MPALDFDALDDIVLAVSRYGDSAWSNLLELSYEQIGPLVELTYLHRFSFIQSPHDLRLNSSDCVNCLNGIYASGESISYSSPSYAVGFMRAQGSRPQTNNDQWDLFYLRATNAAEASGLPRKLANGLIGAIQELEDNIYVHSARTNSGLIGYRMSEGEFEFVIADAGIGVLASLKKSLRFQHLNNHGTAIQVALENGNSRFDPSETRGFGFKPLFDGLQEIHSSLRFRSGDCVLQISGERPTLKNQEIAQRHYIGGFHISVQCKHHGRFSL